MLTVLMSIYNSAGYLREAIESTLAQTFGDFELVVVDDGSTDNGLEIIREYEKRDKRIRVLAHPNWGVADSLNDAAKHASHDWLFRMDPDDVMMPNRLERQWDFLKRNPDLAVASSLVYLIDGQGKMIGKSRSPYTTRKAVSKVIAGTSLIGFHHPAAAIRKSVFDEVGGYRQKCWPAEDLDLWNRIAERGHMMLVQTEYLLKYRVHSSSISISAGRHQVLTIDWVENCKNRRRAGLAELSFTEYLAARDQRPWFGRINDQRKTIARTLYKAAVHHWSMQEYLRCFPELAAALALEPRLVLPRVLPRLAG